MSDATGGHPLERLSAYLDDELPLEDRAPIDRHLAVCPDCRDHLEALRRLSRAIAGEPVPPFPPDFEERILRRIDAAAVVPLRRRRFVVPASVAATIAAVGLVAVVAWKRGGRELTPMTASGVDRTPAMQGREKAAADRTSSPPASAPLPAAQTPPPPAAVPAGEIAKSKRAAAVADKPMAKSANTEREAEGAPGGVVGGVVGGVLGGVAGGVDAQPEGGFAESKDERSADAIGGSSRAAPAASAPRSEVNAPMPSCADPVEDLGVEAVWEIADPAAAVRDIEALALAHGGRLEMPGAAPPAVLAVVLPRERYVDFATAARTMGIGGLENDRAVAGAGCIRQRIVLRTPAER